MPHIHEKIDFVADVFVVYKNKVLLRMHDKYHIWAGVGGHIELDEDPNQAAVREVQEEVGLHVHLVSSALHVPSGNKNHTELIPPNFLNRHRIDATHEHISLVYFAKSTTDKVQPGGSDQSHEWMWLTKEELACRTDLMPHIKFYALQALEEPGEKMLS